MAVLERLVGLDAVLLVGIVDLVLRPPSSRWAGCFSPKLFFHLQNR